MKKIKPVISFILIISLSIGVAALLSSCEKSSRNAGKGTVTIEGKLEGIKGTSPEGLTFVLLDSESNDYSVKIGEGGYFTVNGIIPDTTLALCIEDDKGNRNNISYYTMKVADSVSLGDAGGKNMNGYLVSFIKPETEKVYATFYLTSDKYIGISYFSDECAEKDAVTTAPSTTKVENQKTETTKQNAIF